MFLRRMYMKRIILIITALMMLVMLCACGDSAQVSSDSAESDTASVGKTALDLKQEADSIIQQYSLSGGKRYSSGSTVTGEYLDEDLVRSYYGDAAEMPDFSQVEAYEVYIDESKPINPCEFGIFKMKDGADTDTFILFLKARIDLKLQNAKAYPSMDTEPLKTAVFTSKGGYVWYTVVKDGNADINKALEGKV